MRSLIAFLVLMPLSTLGAAGDYLGAQTDTNGWQLWLEFASMNTNGTFASGLGVNNTIEGSQKVTVNLTSQGYDDTGTLITVPRTLYGTKWVRFASPNNAFPDTSSNATSTMIKVALSDYVYAGDSNITATLASGVYSTNSVTSAAATSVTVTNSSTRTYPKCIANWSWPGCQLSGSAMPLKAVAFHRSAQNGRPVRLVKFTATGATSGVSVTNFVTAMSIDGTMGDAVPVCEYSTSMSLSGMTQGELVRCDFAAYPWIGNSSSVADTSANANTWPTPLMSSITNLCDRTGAYGQTVAVVSTGGNDSTGVAVDLASFNPSSPPNAFLSINKAASIIAATNNIAHSSRNNVGGGIIYVRYDAAAGHLWTGGSSTVPVSPIPWASLLVTTFPNDTQAIISTNSGNKHLGATTPIILSNLNLTLGVNVGAISSFQQCWVDKCTINNTGGGNDITFYQVNLWPITRSTITALSQSGKGVQFYSGGYNCNLLRGCTIPSTIGGCVVYTALGNLLSGGIPLKTFETSITPLNSQVIFAYNKITSYNNATVPAIRGYQDPSENTISGGVFAQNQIESIANNQATIQLAADGVSNDGITNVMVWNNTCAGAKVNVFYNESGSTVLNRSLESFQNNLIEDNNIKSDTFPTANAARVGNWSALYGVGSYGNFDGAIGPIGAPIDFQWEFLGINSYQTSHGGYPQTGFTNTLGYIQFVDRKAYTGSAGAGNGNYRLQSASPALAIQSNCVLPFDLDGNYRGNLDPPGAYASASPRKGAGFFAP